MRYESENEGIRVSVQPSFSLAESDPADGTYVFSYEVGLHNAGVAPVQLLFRHWHIHDAGGEDAEVDGEGVVGQQPILVPGAFHSYSSFCVLHSPVGYMEGYYTFTRPEGDRFRVDIPRFNLEAPLPPPDVLEGSELSN